MAPLGAAAPKNKTSTSNLIKKLAVTTDESPKSIKSKLKSSVKIAAAIAILFTTLKSKESKINKLEKLPEEDPELEKLEEEMDILQEQVIELQDLNNTDSSSFIGSATFTPELQTVNFVLNGNSYHYCSVPRRKWDSYVGSPSKGAAYNRLFKGQHTC